MLGLPIALINYSSCCRKLRRLAGTAVGGRSGMLRASRILSYFCADEERSRLRTFRLTDNVENLYAFEGEKQQ
jgi:hypothetical protein